MSNRTPEEAPAPTVPTSPLVAENVNYLWAQLLFGEWARLGLAEAIVCPGSRSSPLAIAAARTAGLGVVSVTDERCAGFIALGSAKRSGRPVVVVTTSGTAVANLLPSAVEASMAAVPILLVTADRPSELRDCGANQAIDQTRIFGGYSRWSFELPAPSIDVDPAFVLSTADEAWVRAGGPIPGPVHLNCAFREPLAPSAGLLPELSPRLRAWARGHAPFRSEPASCVAAPGGASEATTDDLRVLVLAGDGSSDAAAIAASLGAPLVADATASGPAERVACADVVVAALADERCAALAERLLPDVAVRLGGAIASKRLAQLAADTPRLLVERRVARQDERHAATEVLPANPAEALRGWAADREFAALWRQVGAIADRAVEKAVAATRELTEPFVARQLPRHGRGGLLVVGSSMPIRDVDMFQPLDATVRRVLANRGASGIDGLVSTAVGAALDGTPTTLLLGDLSLLHDLGGLGNVRLAKAPLHVVVVNNDGGGIFHFLPLASEPAASQHFEQLFGTPHGRTFRHAAAMFGLGYRKATSRAEASAAFAELDSAEGPLLVECVTDRATNVATHRAIQRAVADALAKEFA